MKKLTVLIVLSFIIQTASVSQSCLPEGIIFTTQTAIDNFQTNYPNCTEIEGDVEIRGNNITNLGGLAVLTLFDGLLWIEGNPALSSLSGLDNVTSVGGTLWIDGNHALTSLSGLDNVTSVGGLLWVLSNESLASLTGLGNLSFVGNNLAITQSDALTSLTGLDNVASIGGNLWISGNDALTSFSGLENLTSIGQNLSIGHNDALTSLVALNNVSNIGGIIYIQFNEALASLTGLEKVTSIGGNLIITVNASLTSMSGLDNITSIDGDLSISTNDALTSLSGLENLTSIDGTLLINNNPELTSLTGIDKINATSIQKMTIKNNDKLSTCEVQSICDYLENPIGDIEIHDNATGCGNQEEVEEACGTSVDEVFITKDVLTCPNPFSVSTSIEYTLKQHATVKITIYNHLGEQVAVIQENQLKGLQKVIWSPQYLQDGIYYFRLQAGEQMASGKLVLMR